MDSDGGGKLVSIREYIAEIQQRRTARGPDAGPSTQTAAAAVLQELDTAHEELLVADEELRKQSEELERLRQEAAAELRHFRDLFDHAPDGYALTDSHGVIRHANRTLAASLNIPVQFLERKPLINFVARGDCERFRVALVRLGEGSTIRAAAVRFRARKGGAPFFVEIHAVPVTGSAHRVTGIRWALRTTATIEEAPARSHASAPAFARAILDQSVAAVASKRLCVELEVPEGLPLEPELAARWFPILAAVLRAEVARAAPSSALLVAASTDADAVVWRIGDARLQLPIPRRE